jgi:hypothetical protein
MLRMKALQSFEISLLTQKHCTTSKKDFHIEQYGCENLKSQTVCMLPHVFTLLMGFQTESTQAKWITLKFKMDDTSF